MFLKKIRIYIFNNLIFFSKHRGFLANVFNLFKFFKKIINIIKTFFSLILRLKPQYMLSKMVNYNFISLQILINL